MIQYLDKKGVARTYQRDASMISLIPPGDIKVDPSEANLEAVPPLLHQSLTLSLIEEGEHVIIKDTKDSKTWYCAHVLEKLPDRIKVSNYTTTTPSLAKYSKATHEDRLSNIKKAVFLRTWALPTGERSHNCGSENITEEEYSVDRIDPIEILRRRSSRSQCWDDQFRELLNGDCRIGCQPEDSTPCWSLRLPVNFQCRSISDDISHR